MAYFKLEDVTKDGLEHIETNHVVDGIIVPKTFGKLEVKTMSAFEAKVNRFLLWNLLGHIDFPHMLGRNFGELAVLYNEFAKDNAAGKENTMESLLRHKDIEVNSDRGTIIGMLGGVCTTKLTYGETGTIGSEIKLNKSFVDYFNSQGIEVDKEYVNDLERSLERLKEYEKK